MILNEDFFEEIDDIPSDIEIDTKDKFTSLDAYTHKLVFQMIGIKWSRRYENNIKSMQLICKYLKIFIDKCPFVESSSDVCIVLRPSDNEDTINEFQGMLIRCDPEFLNPPRNINPIANGYDTIFRSSLYFYIGVNTSEIDTVRKAAQFINYLFIIWKKTVMMAFEKRAVPRYIIDWMKRSDEMARKYIKINMHYFDVFQKRNQRFFREWYDIVRNVVEPDVKLDKKQFVNYYNGIKDDPYYEYKRYMELNNTGFEININEQNKTVEIYVSGKASRPRWEPHKSLSKLLNKTQQQFPGYELRIIEPKDTGFISFKAETLDELNDIMDMFGNVINSEHRLEILVPKYDMSKFPGGPKIKLNVCGTGAFGIYFIPTPKPPGSSTPIEWEFYSDSGVEIRNPYFYGY